MAEEFRLKPKSDAGKARHEQWKKDAKKRQEETAEYVRGRAMRDAGKDDPTFIKRELERKRSMLRDIKEASQPHWGDGK